MELNSPFIEVYERGINPYEPDSLCISFGEYIYGQKIQSQMFISGMMLGLDRRQMYNLVMALKDLERLPKQHQEFIRKKLRV